jgi:hypothetical protein
VTSVPTSTSPNRSIAGEAFAQAALCIEDPSRSSTDG